MSKLIHFLLVLIVFYLAIGLGLGFAHDAPTGWSYPFTCCSNYDCRSVTASSRDMFGAPVPGVITEPSATNPNYVINRTGEQIGPDDSRIRMSPDGDYHWCSVAGADDGRTIYLFVPPRAF